MCSLLLFHRHRHKLNCFPVSVKVLWHLIRKPVGSSCMPFFLSRLKCLQLSGTVSTAAVTPLTPFSFLESKKRGCRSISKSFDLPSASRFRENDELKIGSTFSFPLYFILKQLFVSALNLTKILNYRARAAFFNIIYNIETLHFTTILLALMILYKCLHWMFSWVFSCRVKATLRNNFPLFNACSCTGCWRGYSLL